MPGEVTTVQGAQPVEYVEETSFATQVQDPAMQWFGLVSSFSVTQGVEAENIRYLPEDGDGTKLENVENVKVSEAYSAEATWSVQSLAELEYWTGAAGGLSDDLTSLQIGHQDEDNGEFRYLQGCVGEELTLTIDEDSVAEVSASFICADASDWTTNDYAGDTDGDGAAGSHATADTSTPFTYGDLGNVNLGGTSIPDAVNSLTLTVSNDLEVVKDPDAARPSQIAAIVPTSREITAELDLTYDDFTMAKTVRDYTAQDLAFDLDTTTFTVSDTKYPEFPYEMAPEDLIGDTVTSDPATNLTWV